MLPLQQIAIVEGDVVLCDIYRHMLHAGLPDCTIVFFEDRQQFFAAIADEQSFQCALLDVDGLDVGCGDLIAHIRDAQPGMALVLIASHEHESLVQDAVALGAEDYLLKGQFDQGLLLRSIRYAVAHHRTQMECAYLHKALAMERHVHERQKRLMESMSHEFRNPLALMGNSLQLLQREGAAAQTARQANGWHKIEQVLTRLRHMVDRVTCYSHLEEGSMSYVPRTVEMKGWIKQFVEEYQQFSPDVVFVCQWSDDEVWVEVDGKLMRQLLMPLVQHAVECRSFDQQPVVLSFRLCGEQMELWVEVPEHQSLGDEGAVCSRPLSHSVMDGMGGYLVDALLAMHSGNLRYERGVKKVGLCAVVSLPLSRHHHAKIAHQSSADRRTG